MVDVLLVLVLIYAALAVLIYICGAAFQAAFYEQRVEGMAWRAPAAAAIFTVFLALAAWLDHKVPGRFGSLFQFTLIEVQEFDQFWSEKRGDTGTSTTLFERVNVPPGRAEFIDKETGRRWQRSDSGVVTAIIVEEKGERRRFNARLDADGNFLCDPGDPNRVLDVEYVEEDGSRVMTEGTIGRLTVSHPGRFMINLLFNLVHLALWIVTIGLLLDLQWKHAILFGVIGWTTVLAVAWWPLAERMAAG